MKNRTKPPKKTTRNDFAKAAKSGKRKLDLEDAQYYLYTIKYIDESKGHFYAYAGETHIKKGDSLSKLYKRPRQHCIGTGNKKSDNKGLIAEHFKECGDLKRIKQGKRHKWDNMKFFEMHIEKIFYPNVLLSSIAELALMEDLAEDGFTLYNKSISGGHEHLDHTPGYREGFNAIVSLITDNHFHLNSEQIEAMENVLPIIREYVETAPDNDLLNKDFYMNLTDKIIAGQSRAIKHKEKQHKAKRGPRIPANNNNSLALEAG